MHRDIKPKNILMFGPKDDMIPKIGDFGVAKRIDKTAVTHTRVGHDLYMAPEVRVLGRYSFPADIFSLSMTLFEMFNEQEVLQSSDEVKQFIMNVISGRAGEIPGSCKVPERLEILIVRGLNETPNKRPALFEFRSALQG